MQRPVTISQIARALHENIREHCLIIGMDNVPGWTDAPQVMRDMSEASIFRMLHYPHIITPELNHQLWVADAGVLQPPDRRWAYGPVFDPVKRTNPRLMPFDAMSSDLKEVSAIAVDTFRKYKNKLLMSYPQFDLDYQDRKKKPGGITNIFNGPITTLNQTEENDFFWG